MITPQDIREKTFEKAVFGGYDMGTVDEFLEEIANDLALLQKENTVLRGKMKVLVEKVEDYRGNEDALRLAIVSAQRLAASIEREAREKANGIISAAEAEALSIRSESAAAIAGEEQRLAQAKRISAKFIESMNAICKKQEAFLQTISEMDFVKAAAPATSAAAEAEEEPESLPSNEVHETVKSIEETVSKVSDMPERSIVPDIPEPQPAFDQQPTKNYGTVSEDTAQFSFSSFSDEN